MVNLGANVLPAQNTVLVNFSTYESRDNFSTHDMVAGANFWYPVGQTPLSFSTLSRTPSKNAAPVTSKFSRLKPTASNVHAGAPDPPENRDQTSWCMETMASIPYCGSIDSISLRYLRYAWSYFPGPWCSIASHVIKKRTVIIGTASVRTGWEYINAHQKSGPIAEGELNSRVHPSREMASQQMWPPHALTRMLQDSRSAGYILQYWMIVTLRTYEFLTFCKSQKGLHLEVDTLVRNHQWNGVHAASSLH